MKEAEIIEQQSAARQQPVAQQQPPASDYSAQWAEYYRSIGKVKEAETIEAQMKQKVMVFKWSFSICTSFYITY